MKKTGIVVAIVVIMLAGAVLVGPSLIDWNPYRDRIAAEIERATGRQAAIDGEISFAILPLPHLTAEGARIANPAGFAERDMLRLKRLEVRIALLPLLRGRIQIEDIRLVEPFVALERRADGRANWDFSASSATTPQAPAQRSSSPLSLAFDRIAIENGTISYRDSGELYRIEKIEARLSAASLEGPFRADGAIVAQGVPVTVDLDLGRINNAAPASVQFTAALRGPDVTLRFDGILVTATDTLLDGTVRLQAPAGRDSAAKYLGVRGFPPALAGAAELRGSLVASPKEARLRDAVLTVGAIRANGTLGVEPGMPPKLEVALSTEAIDLDALLPPATAAQAPSVTSSTTAPPTFSLPASIEVGLRLSCEALTYGGAVVRQAAFEGRLMDGVLTVEHASALLPGESDLRLSGTLKAQQGLPAVDGRIEAGGDNLRRLLEWLGMSQVTALAPDRLRKFTAVAALSGAPGEIRISSLEAVVDETKLTGALTASNTGRPGYGVRLVADRLNVDGYLPRRQAAATPQPSSAGLSGPMNAGSAFAAMDLSAAVEIGSLSYGGVEFSGLTLDGALFKGGLTLRQARVADVAGLSLSAEGTVTGFAPLAGVDLRLAAAAKSLKNFYRAVKLEPPIPADAFDALDLKLHLTGDEKKTGMELAGTLAGGSVEAGGTIQQLLATPAYDLKVRARHPDFAQLISRASPGYRAAERESREVDLYTAAVGSLEAVNLSDLQGRFGPVALRGAASVNWAGSRPRISAQLQTSDIDLNQLLPAAAARGSAAAPPPSRPAPRPVGQRWSTEPIDAGWVRTLDGDLKLTAAALVYDRYRVTEPALAARLDGGALVLEQLEGGLFGGRIGLKGRFEAPEPSAAPRLAADLTVVRAQLREALDSSSDLEVTGLMDFDSSLTSAGRSEAEMVRSLSGTSRLAVRDGAVRGFDLKAVSDRLGQIEEPKDFLGLIGQSMSGGQTRFSALTGSFAIDRGVARTDDLRLQAEAGEGTGRGAIDLPAWTMDMQTSFRLTAHPKAPGFGVRLSGPIDRPQRAFDAGELSAYVAQRLGKDLLRKAAPGLNIPGITAPEEGKPGKRPETEKAIRGLLDSLRR